MLRLKVRLERTDGSGSVELVALANSGFTGSEPEVLVPLRIAKALGLHKLEPEPQVKLTGDGREVELLRYGRSVRAYVVTEDRVEGPVVASAMTSRRARYALLNDKLLGAFKVVLLDFAEGFGASGTS